MDSCSLWVGGILSHVAALSFGAGKGKVSFNPHLCCTLRDYFSSPTLWCKPGSVFRVAIPVSCPWWCLWSLTLLTFSPDHPRAQHVSLVPQLLEIFLCLEQGPEARVCLYFFPVSLVNLGKDTLKRSLICCSLPVFPTEPGSRTIPRSKRLI